MKEPMCCGQMMYQEITLDNRLICICRVCGKTTTASLTSVKEEHS